MKRALIAAQFVIFFAFLVLLPNACIGGEFKAYGNKNYFREAGAPQSVIDNFTISLLEIDYLLRVYNGGLEDDITDLVSSSVIYINGIEVLGPNNFNQKVSFLEVPLDGLLVLGENTISVEVRGKPGGLLTLNVTGLCTDADGDGFNIEGGPCGDIDCNDSDTAINPGVLEACNGIDDNCDGMLPTDEADGDADGVMACEGDCDDADPSIYPGAVELCDGQDTDCDGITPADEADNDLDGMMICAGDCDDSDPQRFLGNAEVCDGKDNDCDEILPVDEVDTDGDGFMVCANDCDDTNPIIHPGAQEICDGKDSNCDGIIPAVEADDDLDGMMICEGDCDDNNASIYQGAEEICGDGIDQDCDGGDLACPCIDADGDKFFIGEGACGPVDCDDTNPNIHPGAKEICEDGVDQDCDGEDLLCVLEDADGDLWAVSQGDCDDSNPDIFPGATDFPGNGIDEDCDGQDAVSPRLSDMDFDGYTAQDGDCHDQNPKAYPGAIEISCNGIDEDCDGVDLCDLTPIAGEKSAFIDGEVFDARTEMPIEVATIKMANVGQVQTDEEGKFSISTPTEGVYLILIEKEGYTYAQRRIRVESGHDFAVEPIYLVPIDPVTVSITPENGGTLINSTNDVELHFEPGAVAEEVQVSATRFYDNRELPGDLPPTSHFTTAVELLPDGMTFEKPVRLLVENTYDIAPGTPVPVGYYRKDLGMWVPDGMGKITDDGRYMEYYIKHFSPCDLNFPIRLVSPENSKTPTDVTDNSNKINEPRPCGKAGETGQSKVVYRDGELMEKYSLPTYNSLGKSNNLSLIYSSNSASPKSILSIEYEINSAEMLIPDRVEFLVNIAGKRENAIYAGFEGKMSLKYLFDGINFRGEQLNSDSYPFCIELINWYPAYYTMTGLFADQGTGFITDSQGNPIRAPEDLPLEKNFIGNIIINNQINSPFGAGWNIADISRIYSSPYRDYVILISGGGEKLHFEGERFIYTFAGPGTTYSGYSGDGGPATLAKLYCPTDVTADGAGNIYIADSNNSRIRRVDPSGIITTIAGNGDWAYSGDGGLAIEASLHRPEGVAVDGIGNVYIADTRNHRIRRVDTRGIITTIAGNGTAGYSGDGGLATQAKLNYPWDLTIDSVGNIYITDGYNHRIRRVDTRGIITTIAGNGTAGYSGDGGLATQAKLFYPRDLTIDAVGNIYITHDEPGYSYRMFIRRVDPDGIISTIAGGGNYYPYSSYIDFAIQTLLNDINGITAAGEDIYFTHKVLGYTGNTSVHQIDQYGFITTIAGGGYYGYSGDGGPATEASLWRPRGITLDDAGNIYITDSDNVRIIKNGKNGAIEFTSPEGDHSKLSRNADGTYTRIMKDGDTCHFNEKGLQSSKVDTNGQTATYTYDQNDRLLGIIDPAALITTFTYNGDNLSSITDPAGRTTQFVHDQDNNLISIITPDSSTTSYAYNNRHLLTSKADPLGRTTQYNYNSHGMIENVVGPDGRINQYSPSDSLGLINDLPEGEGTYDNPGTALPPQDDLHTDPEGNTTIMETDKYGRLLSKTDALGHITTYDRDTESGNLLAVHAPNESSINKEYDDMGNLISYTDGAGNTTTYTYESTFNKVKTITDPLGKITAFDYDENGNLIQITDPLGNTTIMGYYSNGLVHTVTNAKNAVSTYEYNSVGNIIKKTDALGNITTCTYDAAGNMISITDALGNTTTFEYDIMNNLTKVTNPDGGVINYSYDAVGNRISMTDAKGNTTQYQYDSKDRLIRIIDPLLNEINYTYDLNGRVLSKTDAKGDITTYQYNALGHLIQETDPLGNQTTYAYDAMGNRISMTDAKGNITYYEYDLNNQITKVIDPLNGVAAFIYDGNGNLLSITDAKGQITQFVYDSLNRNISVANPLGEQEIYGYDNNGNLTQKTLYSGDTITYQHDGLDRLVKKTLTDGGETYYTFDQGGNLVGVQNPASSLSFTYDNNNRLSTAYATATSYQLGTTITTYTYDVNGNRLSMTDPFGGITSYSYDVRDSLTSITTPNNQITTFTYDENNWRTSKTLPNNVTSLYNYNSSGDLSSLNHILGANAIAGYNYEYDAVGNRTKIADFSGDHNYAYDKLYQLIQADHPFNTETYTYDPVGNRLSSAGYTSLSYDAGNRVLDDGIFTYQYSNGCLTQKTDKSTGAITTYAYNSENKLVGITTPSSTIFYYYDGLGRRICKEVNGVRIYYTYDGEDILLVSDNGYSLLTRFTHGHGIDEPIAMDQGGATYYYLSDGLGSITQLVDAAGNIQQEYLYDSFGNIMSMSGGLDNPYTYTGREYDPESGLYYYRARYYDPQIGRFLSPDPIGIASGDLNLYRYVGNNPVKYIDSYGLWTLGYGIQGSGGMGLGGNVSALVVIDSKGDVALVSSFGGNAILGVNAGAGVQGQWTNADSVSQLKGGTITLIGGSIGCGGRVQGEFVMGVKGDYFGTNFDVSYSIPTINLDVHAGYSWSGVDIQFNVKDLGMSVEEFIDEMKEAAKSGPNSFRDWMEKRNIGSDNNTCK